MSHGFHNAPRASTLGALRNRKLSTTFHGSVLVETSHGPGMVPSYSQDSEILACSFLESAPGGEGGIICRRVPDEEDGKEFTSFKPTQGAMGGSVWCPSNNKFYQGTGVHGLIANAGMCVQFDPLTEEWDMIDGFNPSSSSSGCGRGFYISGADQIWISAFIGNNHKFAVIDPSDNSFTMITDASIVAASDIAQTGDALWVSGGGFGGGKITKVATPSGSATTMLDESIYEAHFGALPADVVNFTLGAIEYIESIGEIWVSASYQDPSLFTNERILRLAETDGSILGWVSMGGAFPVGSLVGMPSYMYYVAAFDRVVFGFVPTLFGPDGILSINPADPEDVSQVVVSATDRLTATKGCFVPDISKVALPVQTGDPGARYYTVKFYDAADLGA